MFKFKIVFVAFLIIFVGIVSANHKSEHSIKERIKPSGKTYQAGDNVPVAKPSVIETTGARDGATIYTQKCAMCHDGGIAGAPKSGDAAAWSDRITKGEEVLIGNAINGFTGQNGVMPAKGGCTDCSDDEIKVAVKHILKLLE